MSGQYPARTAVDDFLGVGKESIHPMHVAETGRQFTRIPHALWDTLRPLDEYGRFQWIMANKQAWAYAVEADTKFSQAEKIEALMGFTGS